MKVDELRKLDIDQLWELREVLSSILQEKLSAGLGITEHRLSTLSNSPLTELLALRAVEQKAVRFRNPEQQLQTWTGRGRRPKWLKEKLASGGSLDDYRTAGEFGNPTSVGQIADRNEELDAGQ